LKGMFAKIYDENSELKEYFPNKSSFSVWMGCHVEELVPSYAVEDIIALRKKINSQKRIKTIWKPTFFKIIDDCLESYEKERSFSQSGRKMIELNAAIDAIINLRKKLKGRA